MNKINVDHICTIFTTTKMIDKYSIRSLGLQKVLHFIPDGNTFLLRLEILESLSIILIEAKIIKLKRVQ